MLAKDLGSDFLVFVCFKILFIYLTETQQEREHKQGSGRGGSWDVGLDPRTLGS